MSNLFKKGFASLALASAMASSVFAGNAAYIDVKVKYLSGTDKATLGFESWNGDADKYKAGPRKDLVELYIRVLDKDGNLADKDSLSDVLIPMIMTRNGHTEPVNNFRSSVSDGNSTGENNISTHTIARSVTVNKNAARYTLDYTEHSSATTVDSLVVKAGNLKKSFDIQLDSVDATSLLVRATAKNSIDATFGGKGRYLNDEFKDIKLLGENTLNDSRAGSLAAQAHSIPQITAGNTIPLRIFASTGANNESVLGKFTMAPNLEGKQIVVIAVGDYSTDGNASVYLGQTELTMKDGIASGDMTISHGLPDRNSTEEGTVVSGNEKFDGSSKFGGLGVAFIAYAKDDFVVNNHKPLKISNGFAKLKTFGIDGNNSNTDAIKVKSAKATTFRGGKFTDKPMNGLASNLWTGNKTDVYILNDRGIAAADKNKTITISVVDDFGNPAILPTSIEAAGVAPTFKVNGKKQDSNDYNFDFGFNNVATGNMITNKSKHGITSADVNVSDGNGTVARTSQISVAYVGNSLAGINPFKFEAHTIDLVGNTPNDMVGDLVKYVRKVEVPNNADTTAYIIHTEEKTKIDFDKMKVSIKVVSAENNATLSTAFLVKVTNRKGIVDEGIYIGDAGGRDGTVDLTKSVKNDGGVKVVIDDNNTVIRISSTKELTTNVIANITLKDTNATAGVLKNTYAGIIGSTTTFILKGRGISSDNNVTHRVLIDSYVATTTTSEGAKDFILKDTSKAGAPGATVIDFDFSGSFVEQFVGKAKATIIFDDNSTAGILHNRYLKAGVVGEPFVSTSTVESSANNNTVTAIIPEGGRLSVALYGAEQNKSKNTDGNSTAYVIESITINGFTPVYTTRAENKNTEAVDISFDANTTVTVKAKDESSAAKVSINKYNVGKIVGNASGDDAKNMNSLPAGLISAASLPSTNPLVTDTLVPVSTNTYYVLFNGLDSLEVRDAYGNPSDMGQLLLEKNYVLSVSDTECAEASINKGNDDTKPAYILFKPCAAGKKIDLTISVSGNEEVKNTITFSNIIKKAENTAFILSLNVGDPDYNTVNNDIVVKVMPDGGTERTETVITVTSDNPDAKVKAVPVDLLIGREFGDLTNTGTTLKATINMRGSYFVITSDKPGKVTVKADAIIPSAESVSGEDVPLTGTTSFTVVNVDTSAPTVTATSTSGSITVTVKDDGLDAVATKVTVNNMSGTETVVAKHTSNGVYVASGLKQGTYSINVYAMDLSGNVHKQTIVQNVGAAGGLSVEEEATAMLIAKKEYEVAGTFTSHNFGADKAKNWIYTRKSDGKSFQLLGNAPSDEEVFGWKETDVKASTSNVWYMIKTGEGNFDWALANADGVAYKLKGAKSDNTFDFSGRLNLNASHKDGMLTFTAK